MMIPPVGKSGPARNRVAFVPRVRRLDQMQTGAAQLVDIVGGMLVAMPHGDPGGSAGEQVREGRRQHDRLALGPVVIVAEIDRVLGQPFEQRRRRRGQPSLGIALGRRIVAVDIAGIAPAVDQRVADVEILRQPRQRVAIDRPVAMRMIVAHHFADDLRAFAEGRARIEPEAAHRIEDAPMHRFSPSRGIGQRPVHDRRQRIGQVAVAERAGQGLGNQAAGRDIGVVGLISHRCGVAC